MKKYLFFIFLILGTSLNAQDKQGFEGEIVYRNFENHSATVRKLSGGVAYNGARSVKVIIRGENMHLYDESMHIHTLFLPKENKVTLFSDVLKKGISTEYGSYVDVYCNLFSHSKSENSYNVNKEGKIQSHNLDCDIYKGKIVASASVEDIGDGYGTTNDVEVWSSNKFNIPDVYKCFLYGLDIPGLATKWIYSQSSKIPFIGKMNSYVCSDLKEIKPRNVADDEMEVPKDYVIMVTDSPFKIMKLYTETAKYLKKNKMYPANADKDMDVTYKIDEEWDF